MKKIFLALLFLVLLAVGFFIFQSTRQKDLAQMTNNQDQLTTLTNELRKYKNSKNSQELYDIAIKRKTFLLAKLRLYPSSFLKYADMSAERANFPENIQQLLEEEVELQGRLIVIISDDFENKISKTDYFLETEDGRYNLYFSQEHPEIAPNSIIKVKAIKIDQNLVVK